MSIVVDEVRQQEIPVDVKPVEQEEAVELVEQAVEEQEPTQEITEEPELPDKYRGKSLKDVIEMHQNVESAYGRQGHEIGEQRKLIDELVQAREQATTIEPQTEDSENTTEDFYEDPVKAVNSAIEKHPDIVGARKQRAMAEQQLSLTKLESAHPDFRETVENTDFKKWVDKSKIRKELFKRADQRFDFLAADELLGTWKQLNMISKTKEVKAQEKTKREKAFKQTSTESRSSGDTLGGKKIYRRSDLINLQVTNPTRYADLAEEIQEAYAEGRVK
jgi:hypothetical protein